MAASRLWSPDFPPVRPLARTGRRSPDSPAEGYYTRWESIFERCARIGGEIMTSAAPSNEIDSFEYVFLREITELEEARLHMLPLHVSSGINDLGSEL